MSGRNLQVMRIYRIIEILEESRLGVAVSDIQERLQVFGIEVGIRTVYRDLEAIQAAGFPLVQQEKSGEAGSRWRLEEGVRNVHSLTFSPKELLSLFLARRFLGRLRDMPFFNDLEMVFEKIEGRVGQTGRGFLGELADEIQFEHQHGMAGGFDSEVLDTVRAACTERQELTFHYASVHSGTSRLRRVGPHCLYFARGSLYLLAEDLESHEVKTFSLLRMRDTLMLDIPFDRDAINPQEHFGSSFGIYRGGEALAVAVAFVPPVASYVRERTWHPSQQVEEREGGACVIRLRVSISPELVQWVLGFGRHAEVLEPEELREAVEDEASAILSLSERLKRAS